MNGDMHLEPSGHSRPQTALCCADCRPLTSGLKCPFRQEDVKSHLELNNLPSFKVEISKNKEMVTNKERIFITECILDDYSIPSAGNGRNFQECFFVCLSVLLSKISFYVNKLTKSTETCWKEWRPIFANHLNEDGHYM